MKKSVKDNSRSKETTVNVILASGNKKKGNNGEEKRRDRKGNGKETVKNSKTSGNIKESNRRSSSKSEGTESKRKERKPGINIFIDSKEKLNRDGKEIDMQNFISKAGNGDARSMENRDKISQDKKAKPIENPIEKQSNKSDKGAKGNKRRAIFSNEQLSLNGTPHKRVKSKRKHKKKRKPM